MKRLFHVLQRALLAVGAAFAAFASTLVSAAPPDGILDHTHASIRAVMALQSSVTPELMKSPDVLGTAAGLSEAGQPAMIILVDRDGPKARDLVQALPAVLGGIAVRVELTDKIRAFAGKPSGGRVDVSHTAMQATPIYLGTSGSWRFDLANGYCCGGTLGSLLQVNGIQYILSNYHVFESDIVSGGN